VRVRDTEREREMSGWDEGAVYYSDQAHSWRGGNGGEHADAEAASRHSVLQKFKEFIRGFETDKNVFPYRESLVHNPKSLLVDMEELDAFDPDVPSLLRSAPADYLPLVIIDHFLQFCVFCGLEIQFSKFLL
jgi:DNA replication licensing factor MCM5